MVNEFIIQPLCLMNNALLTKSETFGNRSTFAVLDRTANVNAIEIQFRKSMDDQSAAGLGHNVFAFKSFSQPITGPTDAVFPINTIVSDDASQFAKIPNTSHKAFIICELFPGCLNKMQ